MHPHHSKQLRSIFIVLTLVIATLGVPARPARGSVPGLVSTSLSALTASITNTTRVSVDSSQAQATGGDSDGRPSISSDGNFVAFQSSANNLVSGDTNGFKDIFLRDIQAGTTTRISVSNEGTQANNHSYNPSISADGRYVSFQSDATNLVNGDTGAFSDIFLRDTQSGITTLLSVSTGGVQGDNNSYSPSISADGRYVAFQSDAGNLLVSGDTNGFADIFLRDTIGNITSRLSVSNEGVQGDGISYNPSISADGRYVAFHSDATNLVDGDTNGIADIFLRDTLDTGITTRLSVSTGAAQADGASYNPSISADGRYVAFQSDATNLVSGDSNGSTDIFLRDTQSTGVTTRLSVSTGGLEGNGDSYNPSISGDGRKIAFSSFAINLVSDDTNSSVDIFLRDTLAVSTARLSIDSLAKQGNGPSYDPSISADGLFVTFGSFASNLVGGDTNGLEDVFIVPALYLYRIFLPLVNR